MLLLQDAGGEAVTHGTHQLVPCRGWEGAAWAPSPIPGKTPQSPWHWQRQGWHEYSRKCSLIALPQTAVVGEQLLSSDPETTPTTWLATSHVCFFFPPSKVIPSTILISSWVNNLKDQVSTSQKGKTLLHRESDSCQELFSPWSTQTTKKGLWNCREKGGCPLQELIGIGNTRCYGSYFSGYERNGCSPNKISGSWEMCAMLLRTMFWLLEKQLEDWMQTAAGCREMLFTEETAVSKAESKIWRLKA